MKNKDNENTRKIRERFSSISIKKGFFSVLFILIPAVVGFLIVEISYSLSSTWRELIVGYIMYAIPLILFGWAFRGVNQPIRSIFKGDTGSVSQVLMVIPLIAISIGVAWILILGLNLIDAEAAEYYLNWLTGVQVLDFGSEISLLHYVLFYGLVAIVVPVVEEIIFRGIMIERLGAKYNYWWAVVISSFIFGVLHLEPVGAFVFGVVLSLVYLQTQSLKIPVLIHAINNTLAMVLTIANKKFAFDFGGWETTGPYISNAWAGIFLFTMGIIWVGWYIKQNWKNVVKQQPFTLELDPEIAESRT